MSAFSQIDVRLVALRSNASTPSPPVQDNFIGLDAQAPPHTKRRSRPALNVHIDHDIAPGQAKERQVQRATPASRSVHGRTKW
ncbi:MAG: hypothetical protein OXH63_26910 [Gemmatimonadetes bacterium]|nr:hypothetical protein [Gemmatimonadota bacterium]